MLFFTSCKTSEEIYFKKDFSGQFTSTIDYKQSMEMMQTMAAQKGEKTSTDSIKLVVDELLKKTKEGYEPLKKIKGITDVKMEILNDNSYKLDFKFADVVALNEAYNKMLQNSQSQQAALDNGEKKEEPKFVEYFSLKSKEITYTRPFLNKDTKQGNGQAEEIQKMMEYKMKFSFEKRKIKKITNNNKLDVKSDETSVTLSPNVETLQKGFTLKIQVK